MKKLLTALLALAVLALGAAAFAEGLDGQNPVMNLVGTYMDEVSQRAVMTIECLDGDQAGVMIEWANGASEEYVWFFTGTYATDAGIVPYEDCRCVKLVFDDLGNEDSELIYEGGTGYLLVNEDWTITWIDDVDDAGEGCLFSFCTIGEDFVEEGQNPVMNFVGEYVDSTSGRAYMTISCLDLSGAEVTIEWADSAFASVVWCFTGSFDAETNALEYTDCVKSYVEYADDGSISVTDEYTNGTGRLLVSEDWTITWIDDMENAGSECLFEFLSYVGDAA